MSIQGNVYRAMRDLVELHVGHGRFDEFLVAACDGETALLVEELQF